MTKRDLKELSSTLVFLIFSLFAAAVLTLAEMPSLFSNLSGDFWIVTPIVRFSCVFGAQFIVSEWLLRRYTGSGKLLLSVIFGLILGIFLLSLANLIG